MGTTAQKLQRLLDTKEGLKDTINNYLGQDITSAIPFKDYETYIKNFYGSLPKTDYAEGTEITLSNTLKGKLDFEDNKVGYGDTKQEGTPTPDNPQEIEVVRGTQTVYIKDENNNIIDTKTINLGEYEFAKIGNYVDTIEYDLDEDKVYKNKAIEKIANKTNWIVGSIASNNRAIIGLRTNGYQNAVNSFSTANGLSNSFVGISQPAIASTTQTNVIAINGDNIYIKFPDEINTKELAKAQLDSMTNLDFYYPLASTLKQEITGTLKDQIKALYNSQSFTGTTIIEIDGQLPLMLKVRALKGE